MKNATVGGADERPCPGDEGCTIGGHGPVEVGVRKTADDAVGIAGAVVGEVEQILVLDLYVLADEFQLAFKQGAQVLASLHSVQEQAILAQGMLTFSFGSHRGQSLG